MTIDFSRLFQATDALLDRYSSTSQDTQEVVTIALFAIYASGDGSCQNYAVNHGIIFG